MGLLVFLELLGDGADRREDVGEPNIPLLRQFLRDAVNLLIEHHVSFGHYLKLVPRKAARDGRSERLREGRAGTVPHTQEPWVWDERADPSTRPPKAGLLRVVSLSNHER
jgi:hypothetical protein